eukprot:3195861-Amphidinium_carterae.3
MSEFSEVSCDAPTYYTQHGTVSSRLDRVYSSLGVAGLSILGYTSQVIAPAAGRMPSDHLAVVSAPKQPRQDCRIPKWITHSTEWF